MEFNYKLNEYSVWNALAWGNCRGHFKKAAEGTWSHNGMRKFKHGLIGAVETLPVISQIASLFEYIIVTKLDTRKEKPIPHKEESAPLPGRVSATPQLSTIPKEKPIPRKEESAPLPGRVSARPRLSTIPIPYDIKFNVEEVLQLKDLSSINLDSVNYEESLEVEKNSIEALISSPHLTPLIDYIKRDDEDVRGLQALYVILGIKPVCVFEYRMKEELLSILNNLLPLIGKEGQFRLSTHTEHHYLVNEYPLEAFDPRRYLTRLHPHENTDSLVTAIEYCFPNQNQPQTDQILSYLLGFGPSWESYASLTSYVRSELPEPLFSDRHYKEIGTVLKDHLTSLPENYNDADLGTAYHQQLKTFAVKRAWNFRVQQMEQQKRFNIKGIDFSADGIVVRTDYYKKMRALTKWITDTLTNKN